MSMYISWLGQGCFRIKGKDFILVIDPFESSKMGFKLPALKADMLIISDPLAKRPAVKPIRRPDREEARTFEISSPGEYEMGGIFVYGIPLSSSGESEEGIIYRIEIEGMAIAHLGALKEDLKESHLDRLNGIDILIVPAGGDGKSLIDSKKAAEIVGQIEPRIAIPSFYRVPQLKNNLEPIDSFCKETGFNMEDPIDKLKISKKDLPQGETEAVFLKI